MSCIGFPSLEALGQGTFQLAVERDVLYVASPTNFFSSNILSSVEIQFIRGVKTSMSGFLAPGAITNKALITTIDGANDRILVWDQTDGTLKSVAPNNLPAAGGGEANTGSNVGTGVGVFRAKSGIDLQYKSLTNSSTRLDLSTNDTMVLIDVNEGNLDLANIGGLLGPTQLHTNVIAGQTEDTTPDSTDAFLIIDSATGLYRKVQIGNLPGGGAGSVTHTTGALTVDLPVLGNGGDDIKSSSASNFRTVLSLVPGTDVQAFDSDLAAVAGLGANGLVARTGTGTMSARTITGTPNEIDVTNGDGVSANPAISLPSSIDLGAKVSFEVPNAAAPTTDAFGEIAGDNNAWAASRGTLVIFDGTANTFAVNVLASDTPANGQVPVWNTGGTITWETAAGSGTILGSVGAVDNVLIRSDGTGGSTIQGSSIIVADDWDISGVNLFSATNLYLQQFTTSTNAFAIFDDKNGNHVFSWETNGQFIAYGSGTATMDFGSAGVRLTEDGDGAVTFASLGNGSGELGSFTINLDDTADVIDFTSSTAAAFRFPSITLTANLNLPDDIRQTFNPGTTTPGLNVGSFAGDPSGPSNGDLWYDSTANELTARINGANVALGAGGGGGGTNFSGILLTNTFAQFTVDKGPYTNIVINWGETNLVHWAPSNVVAVSLAMSGNTNAGVAQAVSVTLILSNNTTVVTLPWKGINGQPAEFLSGPSTNRFDIVYDGVRTYINSHQALTVGTGPAYLVQVLASDTPSNGQVLKYNTDGSITWETDSTGGTPTFDSIATGENTTASMKLGTGSTLSVQGTGENHANILTNAIVRGALTFPDNVRQTFNPGANAAGINVGSHAGDPDTPSNGDLWYDSTANELTARINGANVALGAGGGGGGTNFSGILLTNTFAQFVIDYGNQTNLTIPWGNTNLVHWAPSNNPASIVMSGDTNAGVAQTVKVRMILTNSVNVVVLPWRGLGGQAVEFLSAPSTNEFDIVYDGIRTYIRSYQALTIGTGPAYLVQVLASDTPSNGQVLKYNTDGSITWEADSTGGSPTFDAIASGQNTTAAMQVGSGATISVSGGQVHANITTNAVAQGTFDFDATGVRMTGTDGRLTMLGLGDGSDENLILDLDNTSNFGILSSGTGLTTLWLTNINLRIGNTDFPATPGAISLANNTPITWGPSGPGSDVRIYVSPSEEFVIEAPIASPTVTELNIGSSTDGADLIPAAGGALRFFGHDTSEDFTIDFTTATANEVGFSSSTGADKFNFTGINLQSSGVNYALTNSPTLNTPRFLDATNSGSLGISANLLVMEDVSIVSGDVINSGNLFNVLSANVGGVLTVTNDLTIRVPAASATSPILKLFGQTNTGFLGFSVRTNLISTNTLVLDYGAFSAGNLRIIQSVSGQIATETNIASTGSGDVVRAVDPNLWGMTVSNSVGYSTSLLAPISNGSNYVLHVNREGHRWINANTNIHFLAAYNTDAGGLDTDKTWFANYSLTNLSTVPWNLAFNSTTNRWKISYNQGNTLPTILTNGTRLDINMQANGSNIVVSSAYYSWP